LIVFARSKKAQVEMIWAFLCVSFEAVNQYVCLYPLVEVISNECMTSLCSRSWVSHSCQTVNSIAKIIRWLDKVAAEEGRVTSVMRQTWISISV